MNIADQGEAWKLAYRVVDALESIAESLEAINERERQKTL